MHHVFISGPIVVKVWYFFEAVFNFNFFRPGIEVSNLLEGWFVNIKGHVRNVIPSLICWFLWLERNDALFNGITMNYQRIIQKIMDKVKALFSINLLALKHFKNVTFTLEFFSIQEVVPNPLSLSNGIIWCKPSNNSIKINIDYIQVRNITSAGGLLRDHNGAMVLAFAGITGHFDRVGGLLSAIHHGLNMCVNFNVMSIVLEVNSCFNLIFLLSRDDDNCSYFSFYTIRSINGILSSINCTLSMIREEGNALARHLALLGVGFDSFIEFSFNQLPNSIKGLVNLDRMGFPDVYC
ncbi:hypothetical protein KFK09_020410 [Dendrobium nobile]|uniref:RNase H type-1 domain-containing protein n=1 Tax=Dendrobium nobile TaxID=94219 RepID=A0A8T3AMF3_DENNO|nr:hypothetical protein KFK09_020410 [Dendrobium nobile]